VCAAMHETCRSRRVSDQFFCWRQFPAEKFYAVGEFRSISDADRLERMVSERHRLIALSSTGYSDVAVLISYDQFCFFRRIEHLAAEHPPAGSKKMNHVDAIGNLIFVSEDTNKKLKNKDFAAKKAILDKDNVPMDSILDKAKAWTDPEITSRSNLLAKVAYKTIWKL
jgi:hypothetical protein